MFTVDLQNKPLDVDLRVDIMVVAGGIYLHV